MTTPEQARKTFSQDSLAYAEARPHYPPELFRWLAERTPSRGRVWDCATGNGQAAIGLAPFFEDVRATDISEEQVRAAIRIANVEYSIQPAESTNFPNDSFDLITVAQSLHWFDYPRFWPEVQRVSKNGALFCAWGYAWLTCDPDVDSVLVAPIRSLIAGYWAPNNRILWHGYRTSDIDFPFDRLVVPSFQISTVWSVDQIVNYMTTWSAYKRASINEEIYESIQEITEAARRRFADREPHLVVMPLTLVAGVVVKE